MSSQQLSDGADSFWTDLSLFDQSEIKFAYRIVHFAFMRPVHLPMQSLWINGRGRVIFQW